MSSNSFAIRDRLSELSHSHNLLSSLRIIAYDVTDIDQFNGLLKFLRHTWAVAMGRDATTIVQSPLTTTFTVFLQYNSHILDDFEVTQRRNQIKYEIQTIMEPILATNPYLNFPEIISMPSSIDEQCELFTSILTRYIINLAVLRMKNDEELLFAKSHPETVQQQEKQYATYQELVNEQEERQRVWKMDRLMRRNGTKAKAAMAGNVKSSDLDKKHRQLLKEQLKLQKQQQKLLQQQQQQHLQNGHGAGSSSSRQCNIM